MSEFECRLCKTRWTVVSLFDNYGCPKCDRPTTDISPPEVTSAFPSEPGPTSIEELENMRARKDAAYMERNSVVALMLRMALELGWKAGIGVHQDAPGVPWDPEWRTLVTVDLPTGQASWHVHDSERHLFDGLPAYEGAWDGHDTSEKYRRLAVYRPNR